MSMLGFSLLMALVGALTGFLIFRRPVRQDEGAPRDTGEYRAVSIAFDKLGGCRAVHAFAGQRILSSEAPRLPVPDCNVAECACRFQHHADRRGGVRRASDAGAFEPLYSGSERRAKAPGRRAEDRAHDVSMRTPIESDPSATYFDFIAQTGGRHHGGD